MYPDSNAGVGHCPTKELFMTVRRPIRAMAARLLALLLVFVTVTPPGFAVINPFDQPIDQTKKHHAVLTLRVTAVDPKEKQITARVTAVTTGAFAPTDVRIQVGDAADQALFSLGVGQILVAFVGKKRKGHEEELLCYAGAGNWYLGRMSELSKPDQWQWNEIGDPNSMGGIFNGSATRLAELMADIAAGRDFFPAKPAMQFRLARELGAFTKASRGVALVDLDGDGRLDAIATSESGVRAWLQRDDLAFADATAALGLAGITAASSVAMADVDGSGRTALLLDGVLWQRSATAFMPSARLPPIAGLLSATFADVDSDGWPDVLAGTATGPRVLRNPAKADAPFTDATSRLGLDRPDYGGGQPGMITAVQDWDGHGGCALFLGARRPLLLLRGKDGGFHPVTTPELECAPADDGGRTGGAVIGPLWQTAALSVLVPRHGGFSLLVPEQKRVLDYIGACNETSEYSSRQLWTLAEDLDADGNSDIYTASGAADVSDVCHLNRGYGSFMRPMKQDDQIFPAAGHGGGSWGVAAGDVNGDGAVDLLLGGTDGHVRLLINESLKLRTNLDESAVLYLTKVAKARLLAVDLVGARGAIGASLRVTDQQGRLVARRECGGNGVAGSWSSGPSCLAIREAGAYTLTVRWSDGAISAKTVTIDSDQVLMRRITMERPPTAR